MSRSVHGTKRHDRRKKILRNAKGYWERRNKLFRSAKEAVERSQVYAYRDRRNRKRTFRSLWIVRISAICRQHGMSYSQFMYGLKRVGVQINRKALSNLAIQDPETFMVLMEKVKEGTNGETGAD